MAEEYQGRHFKGLSDDAPAPASWEGGAEGRRGEPDAGSTAAFLRAIGQDVAPAAGRSDEGGSRTAEPGESERMAHAMRAGYGSDPGETAMFMRLALELDAPSSDAAAPRDVRRDDADASGYGSMREPAVSSSAAVAPVATGSATTGAVRMRRRTDSLSSSRYRSRGKAAGAASVAGAAPVASAAPAVRTSQESRTSREVRASQGSRESAGENVAATVGRSAALISICVMISRITGFIRTWAMGFAMGTTLLSSSYQVACNLPNQLYELVMGGMLVTAFLPVYVSLRKREGERRANEYASTLMGIALVFLGVVALLATVFAPQVVFTQMFLNASGDRELVTYFFRFFAVQLVFYGVSAIAGGLLNAQRDYFWSSAAPIANNVVVIAVMFVYVFVAPQDPELGKLFIAVGTPLGVLVQMAMQIPPLAKNGIRLKPWRIDLHDPALRETLSLGIPTIIVTLGSFATVSVQNAAAMAVSDAGSSVLFYARQWFTLPYAFLSVPLTTTLFTELSNMVADGDMRGMRQGIGGGTRQNLYFMVPFALYLMVFSVPLVSLFCAGSFTEESVGLVAHYLSFMALSLPFYALFLFMQKVFSALRRMKTYAVVNVVASVVQIVLTLLLSQGIPGVWDGMGLTGIALAQLAFFVVGDVWCYLYLRSEIGLGEGLSYARSAATSLGLGLVGAVGGGALLWVLETFVSPIGGNIALAFVYVVVCGLVSLALTYGLSIAARVPEAQFITRLLGRFALR